MLAFDKAVFDALKPGGVFVVLDHAAAAGTADDHQTPCTASIRRW